jgi:hypothetical protein
MPPPTTMISAINMKLPVNLTLSFIFPMRTNSLCEILEYSAVVDLSVLTSFENLSNAYAEIEVGNNYLRKS